MPYDNIEIDFSRFNNIKFKEPENDFVEIPDGEYICRLESITFGTSKIGNPKQVIVFNVVEGEFLNKTIYINNVLFNLEDCDDENKNGLKIYFAKQKIRELGIIPKDLEPEHLVFKNLEQYSKLIAQVNEKYQRIKRDEYFVYSVEKTTKGKWTSYKITKIED